MRKYQRAAVAAAMLGGVSFLGAGVGHAADGDARAADLKQNQTCSANRTTWGLINIDRLNLAINILGLQANDQSQRTSVNCTQAVPVGR